MVGPPAFGTVTREAVPQQIVSRLLDLIQQRHLGPGDRLPAERELAASMGVSRSSLREALRALTVLGVTEMRHGAGTYISSLEPELLVRPPDLRALARPTTPRTSCSRRARWSSRRWRRSPPQRIDDGTLDLLEACVERARRGDRRRRGVHGDRHRAARRDPRRRRQRDARSLHGVDPARSGSPAAAGPAPAAPCRSRPSRTIARSSRRCARATATAASAAMHRHLENVERNAREEEL